MSDELQVHLAENQLVTGSSPFVADVKSPPLCPPLLTFMGCMWYICKVEG